MTPVVTLREMCQDEYDSSNDQRDQDWVESMTGTLPPEAAREQARRGREEFLPQGLHTEGHRLLVAENAAGEVVGSVWVGFEEPRTKSTETAWLYDIRVDAAHRRSGYGTAILAEVEALARDSGALRLGLNVFGSNTAAIRLYETSGYEVTTQQMAKRLR